MKVPSEIKRKMHMAARHFSKGWKLMLEVDEWIESKGIDDESVRNDDGYSLEEIECGNDVIDAFCDNFEKRFGNTKEK